MQVAVAHPQSPADQCNYLFIATVYPYLQGSYVSVARPDITSIPLPNILSAAIANSLTQLTGTQVAFIVPDT